MPSMYDVVLASNGAPSTCSMDKYLQQCKLLLCKGGILVLYLQSPWLSSCMRLCEGQSANAVIVNGLQSNLR